MQGESLVSLTPGVKGDPTQTEVSTEIKQGPEEGPVEQWSEMQEGTGNRNRPVTVE